MIGMCGTYCGVCEWKEKTNCPGCQACQGKPFWGECSIAKCSINNEYNHCGHCPNLPCDKLQDAFNNKEHGDNGERLINLKNWANGKETYLKLRMLNIDNKSSEVKKAGLLKKYNLTQNEMCSLIEDGLVDYVKTVSKNGSRPFVLNEKIGWVKTFPTAWSNYIFYSNFDIKDVDNELSQVISKINDGELPCEWVVGPKSKPINLCNYLEKNNFVKQYDMAGMAINIMDMDTSVTIPKDVNIVAADNEEMIKLWADVVSKGLWNGNTFEACLFENLIHDPNFKFYLAFLNGEPVASSMLQLSKGVASIDMVSTLRKYWHMGIGTAMTKIPLLYAKDKGYKIGVLQASEAGEHGYRKIGFEEYCRFNVYAYQK